MEEKLIKSDIESRIFTIRGMQVMLDSDLAYLYSVTTKSLNQAVKRNISRFPEDFCFVLDKSEFNELVTNCDRLINQRHRTFLPTAFTELGISMLSSILKSRTAIDLNIQIMRVFVALRDDYYSNRALINRISLVESLLSDHSRKFKELEAHSSILQKQSGIFFNDQIFDAYVFSSELISKAKKSIILIDNYIDESTLIQLSKRNKRARCLIYTEKLTEQLKLDLEKHNAQYPPINIHILKNVHDRFLIIDKKELYHLGASLKDLGKRWFGFSRIDSVLAQVLERLE